MPTQPDPMPAAWSRWRQYLLALATVAAALLARDLLQPVLGAGMPFLFVFGALLILVQLVPPGPFLAAAVLGGTGVWLLFRPMPWLDIGLFAATAAAAALVAWISRRAHDRAGRARRQAEQQREALRVTLASIGDAVITSDADGCINFVNPVAERLTGWQQAEALGRPLGDVLRLVGEAGHAPIENPAQAVLRHGQVVGLANHTLLIRRDGSELPIDDSAAPLRNDEGEISGVVLVFRDISERRAAERTRERSERELASFFDTASLGLLWVAPDGKVLRANKAQLDLLGVTDGEYLGKPFSDFHADGDAMAEILAPLARGETLGERPVRLRRADGSVRDVMLRCNALFEDGRFVHLRCFTLDVTERLRAERAQRESEARFRTMADAAPVLIWMAGPDQRCQWFSRPWLEFTGRTPEQEAGDGWTVGVHPDDLAPYLAAYGAAFEARQPFSADYRLRRHDGVYRWLLGSGAPRFDDEGRFDGYIGSALDITARKAAEAALARSEAMFRGLADANLIGVGFGDTRGGTAYLNDEMLRMMGRSRAEFESGGLSWHACVAPEFSHLHDVWRERLLADGSVSGYERAFLRPDGGRTPYVGAAALLEPGSDFHVRIALDLTRLKQAEQDRLQLVAQLQDADRRKDEFLATLAHELRNPLAPVMHSLEIIQRPGLDAGVHERARATIERQLQHMVRLIDDLLDVSRITRDKLELRLSRVELGAVLEQALEGCRPALAAGGHPITVLPSPQPVWLDADPVRLVQVFNNLLVNAGKYSAAGGPVAIAVHAGDGMVELVFKDSGIGIAPEMLPRVFEMFAQGEHLPGGSKGGLGIGLTLARRLVELHGGELRASSAGRGLGSEFLVRLPLATAAAAPPPPALPLPASPPLLALRVLVVDDNHDAAATLAMLLELSGHQTCTAHDGEQALAAAERFRPDVALLDIGLPLLDGREVARRLRAAGWARRLVLVALTGWGQEPDRRASQEAGFDAHLVKPVEHVALLRLLAELLARG